MAGRICDVGWRSDDHNRGDLVDHGDGQKAYSKIVTARDVENLPPENRGDGATRAVTIPG